MAEILVSTAVSVLYENLRSNELIKFATENVGAKFNKWERNLKMIRALLSDAEEKQMGNEAMKDWLEKLQDLAYDAEDILDEYAARSRSRGLMSEVNLNSRIDGITRRLEELCQERTVFRSEDIRGGRSIASWRRASTAVSGMRNLNSLRFNFNVDDRRLGQLFQRRPLMVSEQSEERLGRPVTTSFLTDTVIYGREEDKAKLLEMLLMDEPEKTDVDVISIVGMPGVGKTLFAQQLYNCPEVENHFEIRAWVCVSDDFDVMRISKDLLVSFTGGVSNLRDLNSIQTELKNLVGEKKFLLVLDDVWSENFSQWEVLLSPLRDGAEGSLPSPNAGAQGSLPSPNAGAQGSKIIMTTRHENVALMMTSTSEYRHTLGLLPDDDCWSLFIEHASGAAAVGDQEYSRLIRQKVIEKCQGLPLAVKTLAENLRSEHIDQWLEKLETWEVLDHGELCASLQLSYHHLPPHLKRCFAYCAILPKGYDFEEKEVVLLWMAENLIPQSRDSTQLEDLGGEYFHDLVSRSIFQKSSQNNSKYIMHNLFNDLAQMVFGRRSYSVSYHTFEQWQSTRIRHISSLYYSYTGKSEVYTDLTRLRSYLSLLPVNNWFKPYNITGMLVSEELWKCKSLRALSLQNYKIKKLPDSIEGLSLLRQLNLSGSELRSLPESINLLCNLQTLTLRNCRNLFKLPHSMENLVKLRHFDIFGALLITKMPLGINNWESLRTLSNFIVGKDSGSLLNDLKNLKLLSGEMHITGLENMIVLESSQDMMLSNKKDLKVLLLDWGSKFDGERDAGVEEMVLEMLQPHQNLEELTIRSYCGTQFSWLGNKAFSMSSAITILKLEDCTKCTSLPSLGLLRTLKNLSIKGLIEIKSIGIEFYGENNSTPFPSLESLSLESLEEWEEWIHSEEDESVESYPKLRELSIVKCNKLQERLPKNLNLLEKLVVRNCKELIVSLSTFPSLCKLEIDECKKLVCDSSIGSKSFNSFLLSNVSCAGNWLQQGVQGVEVLSIKACDELVKLLENDVLLEKSPRRHGAISVRELYVKECENVRTLLEGITKYIAGLEILQIESCNSLTSVVTDQLPASLKKLDVRNCINLQRFSEDYSSTSSSVHSLKLENVNSSILQLEELYIQECPFLIRLPPLLRFSDSLTHLCIKKCAKLTSLSSSSPLPTGLKFLEVDDCLKLTNLSPSGKLPETLESLKISGCPKLESIVERFHNNTSLHEIWIEGCEKLKCLPEGISTLTGLREVGIMYCPCLVSFPEGGLPNTVIRLWIKACEKLQALPSQIHNLPCLQLLSIWDCPSMSFHVEGLPKNLESLAIQGHNLYQALKREDLLQLTSLNEFSLCGLPDTLSFEVHKIEKTLPSSLTRLCIECFPNLDDLSSLNLQNLKKLEWLSIDNCPKLKSLPGLPPSLVELYVNKCPLLENKEKRSRR